MYKGSHLRLPHRPPEAAEEGDRKPLSFHRGVSGVGTGEVNTGVASGLGSDLGGSTSGCRKLSPHPCLTDFHELEEEGYHRNIHPRL